MDKFLPRFRDPEVDKTLWLAEVVKLSKTTSEEFADLPDDKQREKQTYYGEAATIGSFLENAAATSKNGLQDSASLCS